MHVKYIRSYNHKPHDVAYIMYSYSQYNFVMDTVEWRFGELDWI